MFMILLGTHTHIKKQNEKNQTLVCDGCGVRFCKGSYEMFGDLLKVAQVMDGGAGFLLLQGVHVFPRSLAYLPFSY